MEPGASTPMHVHLSQTESFRILEGELTLWVAGKRRVVAVGDEASAGPRVPHRFRNESNAPVRAFVELRPALRTRELFEVMFALDRDGRIGRAGAPRPLDGANLMHQFRDEFFFLARIPPRLQLTLAAPLAALARRRALKMSP